MDKQTTLKDTFVITGTGLHTGKVATATFKPAPENHGIKFCRVDLPEKPIIAALADNVVDTSRGTTIAVNDIKVSTIEHSLAALVGCGVDNVLIEVDAGEVPILDGSSKAFAEAINKVGIVEQNAKRDYFVVEEPISIYDEKRQSELIIVPDDDYRLSVMIDFDTKVLGTQFASIRSISEFSNEIASSRTFVFLHELQQLIQHNLIKGGELNNAIVFVDKAVTDKELSDLSTFFNKPNLSVVEEGILNNLELRHPNEPARHKLLDVIGDLALVGQPIKGHVIATRPGHSINTSFAKQIRSIIKSTRTSAPKIDLNAEPVYNINQIQNFLPHRPPFLLVDKIMHIEKERIIGVKNVTMNEPFFVGHFPGEPVMPGVLVVEAMAQAGGVLILHNYPNPEDYTTYFVKINEVKFRNKIVPGDTLVFDLRTVSPIRRGIIHMEGKAYVGDKLVTEADLMAQIALKPTN
ncbi:MAG: bifunctional UDP-3-O-[3-hydroxymyristoyl] N-acetylglucosamine deacetylase/3-hydroxyacyl-ACP dehydratase [Lentimicrobiaceae bacterium]|nr:bifunctional UDP-3-O-[3-hydroxymyristoyl] N-acetylglucosamine deacetylase/3-hydroxyacyl-ACP dehydratase [Lentimicrobiaceae bacterium]